MLHELQLELPFANDEHWLFSNHTCDYIVPFREPMLVGFDEPLPTCLLEEHHKGPHLILRTDGRFMVWEYDEEYIPEEAGDEAILCGEISATEALRLLAKAPMLVLLDLTTT